MNEKAKESANLSTPGSFDDVLPEPEHWTLDHCVDRPGFEKNGLQNSLLVNLFFSRRMLRFGCTKNLVLDDVLIPDEGPKVGVGCT